MPDGGSMDAFVVLPEGGRGPGVLVLMEIFGVGPYIRQACSRLAELGYVAMAPDLYRRLSPGLELPHDEAGVAKALETVQRLDGEGAVADAAVALDALRGLPEVEDGRGGDGGSGGSGGRGRVGAVGFCLGGRLAFGLGAAADPDAIVCYYGSGIADSLDAAAAISCPALFHFGGEDPYIPRSDAEKVAAVVATRPDWEIAIQDDGGHAFDNHEAPMFHRPAAAARAWELTRDFLARRLPLA
jgi:carboxymethylenebutenolidase